MTVVGFERFRERFVPFSSSFCVIGGSACDLLFGESGLSFRATKDLDIVVIVDEPFESFARELWSFVLEGDYTFGWRNNGKSRYYRFSEPRNSGYPFMIELFARHPDFRLRDEEADVAPLPVSDEISSLSAILLDDEYYSFIRSGIVSIEGIGVVDAIHLLPLKARAHIDLSERKAAGQHVNSRDLKKHKKDVLRLTALIPLESKISVPASIANDIDSFLQMIERDDIRTEQIRLDKPLDILIDEIRSHYQVDDEGRSLLR